MELKRWRDELKIDLNLEPKYFPAPHTKAALICMHARELGLDELPLAGAYMRGVWAEDRDITDNDTLIEIADKAGFDGKHLMNNSKSPDLLSLYESYTDEAIKRGVFGAPSYVIDDEIYWGQDRLMFVEKKLKQEAGK